MYIPMMLSVHVHAVGRGLVLDTQYVHVHSGLLLLLHTLLHVVATTLMLHAMCIRAVVLLDLWGVVMGMLVLLTALRRCPI